MSGSPTASEAVAHAVNFAILTAHRLGEPRVLELTHGQLDQLRRACAPADWSPGPPCTYRGLRIYEIKGPVGRVLAWDRARETEMTQAIVWPTGQA
jgi:hypothetical protein